MAWTSCQLMGSEIQETVAGKSDEGKDFSDHSLTSISFRPAKIQNCTLTHELRVFVGTWNVAGRSPTRSLTMDLDEWLNLKSAADIYVLGFQEVVPLNTRTVIGVLEDQTEATQWNLLIGKTLNKKEGCVWLTPTSIPMTSQDYHFAKATNFNEKSEKSTIPLKERSRTHHGGLRGNNPYKLIASKKMVGVFITIWMRTEMMRKYSVSDVKVCSVPCGIMGYLGNKGSVAVSMSIEGTSFCFIAAHLASGEKKGDEGRRNQQVVEIFKRTAFSRIAQESVVVPLPLNIQGHDCVFWFGDLNYRLNLEDGLARELIRRRNFKELQKFDQLKKELEDDGVFHGWHEGSIEFAPTYKYYLSSSNRYTRKLPTRAGDKHRTPAWCDRIIWYGKGIQQLSYVCANSKFSDHRPVSALFTTEIEILNSKPRFVALNLCRNDGQKEVAEEPRSSLRALIRTEVEESAMNML